MDITKKINFVTLNLNKIEYIKITYIDADGSQYEKKTLLRKVNPTCLILEYRNEKPVSANCPQYISVKFVTYEAMYTAKSQLLSIEYHPKYSNLLIAKPIEIERYQRRECCRVTADKAAVLTCTNKNGVIVKYLSKISDVSACGVKLTLLKSLETGKKVYNVNFMEYQSIQMTLYLDGKSPITLIAKYIRNSGEGDTSNYAFHFDSSQIGAIDKIAKYIPIAQRDLKKNNKL